jgi:tRNA-2-methylthio-N6-dimethylallyladenosine synthase
VPYVRGRERSRKPNDILSEIARAAGAGAKEILLLGQNVNSYGKDLDEKEEKTDFAALLRKTAEVGGVERIRFVTSHPKDMTERLIDAIAETPKVCRALHLPFQAGSNAVLRAMNRGYTAEDYLALVEKIRARLPETALTSDVIVGFPGETEEDFADTLRLAEAARFDNLYTFLYSKRAGTPAAKMAGQIPPDVRQNRFDRLLALQARVSREINEGCVGKVFEILLEGKSKTDETQASGRTESGKIVHIPWEEGFRAGDFISVKITRAQTWALFGSLSPFTKSS